MRVSSQRLRRTLVHSETHIIFDDRTHLCTISIERTCFWFSGSLDDGGNVQQNADLGTDNQRWQIVDCGGGWFKLVAKVTSKCLDVNGAASWDGANVQQWNDNSTDAQRWAFIPMGAGQVSGAVVTPGEYFVTAKHSSKVLGVANASTDDAATMSQQDFDGTASSQR